MNDSLIDGSSLEPSPILGLKREDGSKSSLIQIGIRLSHVGVLTTRCRGGGLICQNKM